MSFRDSVKSAAKTLRLGPHYGIERFGVLFGVVLVTFVLIFGGASVSALTNQVERLDSTVLYTNTFTTSKTQLAGDVEGVYVNSDSTRALVLMKFSDPSSVSSAADKYQAFLTGSSSDLVDQSLKTSVTGQIVVFGSTGYLGMVLESDRPFEQQILNLTMRSNSELVYLPSERRKVREDLEGQNSFSEFDQWRLYFNPGASGVQPSTALDGEQFDAAAIFAELVVAPDEAELRTAMDDQLGQMQADLARIGEYESEMRRVDVDGVSIEPPTVPEQIAGDQVVGTAAVTDTPSTLELDAEWLSPSGFDFDWRSGSVAEGYLDKIVPEDESYVTYLAEKAALSKDGEKGGMRVNDIDWELSNGQLLADFGNSDKTMKPLFDIRNGLSQAYQDYYTHKIDYQVDAYGDLIDLELELRNAGDGASVNNGEKALFTY